MTPKATSAGSRRAGAARKPGGGSAGKARAAGRGSASKGRAARKTGGGSVTKWARRAAITTAVAAGAVLVALLVASPVLTWMRQNDERVEADRVAAELDVRIEELEAAIQQRSSDDAVRIEALCFGNFVEPGVELYAVAGLVGCVSDAAPQSPTG